jgi:23S rRNA pseudouridine1911/1915/1917 synthase
MFLCREGPKWRDTALLGEFCPIGSLSRNGRTFGTLLALRDLAQMTWRPPADSAVFEVAPEQGGSRLELFLLRKLPHLTRGTVRRLVAQGGLVQVDGRQVAKGHRLRPGQRVQVDPRLLEPPLQPTQDLPLSILAVTPNVVVINKPPGVACHPLDPIESDTVAHRLVARFPECRLASTDPREGGLVHRLDLCTSGVLLAARQRTTHERMRQLFADGTVRKQYLALVVGTLTEGGTLDAALEICPGDPRKMRIASATSATAQSAATTYAPLGPCGAHTLVEIACHPGRRHLVRAHLAALGHPLVGDVLYGGSGPLADGYAFLHARAIQWGDARYEAPLPRARADVLAEASNGRWPLPEWV